MNERFKYDKEKVKNKKENKKYIYWLDEQKLTELKKRMEEKGIEMLRPESFNIFPCEAFKGDIGYAEPISWGVICKYDAVPWYRASKHAGKSFVASSFPLDEEYSTFLETIIEPTLFDPGELPSREELKKLASDQSYLSRVPEDYLKFPKEWGEGILKSIGDVTRKPPEKLEDYLCIWNAVHSNFVNPKYRAGKEFMHAPYSVADSFHISTCCVELLNLLDSKEEAMLVRPCTGSLIAKAFERDRYYFVRLVR